MTTTDAYLDLAEHVLSLARRPLSTKEIMREGFLRALVPSHLHGRTQHKTLGARLSEDILRTKRSRFYRPRPGRFFLSRFLDDPDIPEAYKTRIIAKRRVRELPKEYLAYIDVCHLRHFGYSGFLDARTFKRLVAEQCIEYRRYKEEDHSVLSLYTGAVVRRGPLLLSHRKGRYAESRVDFHGKKTLFFTSPRAHDDYTLFDFKDHGAVTAALTALAIDLDLEFSAEFPKFEDQAKLKFCISNPSGTLPSLLTVVEVEAPTHYQPFSKKLSIGGFEWISFASAVEQTLNFDPWSRAYLARVIAGQPSRIA